MKRPKWPIWALGGLVGVGALGAAGLFWLGLPQGTLLFDSAMKRLKTKDGSEIQRPQDRRVVLQDEFRFPIPISTNRDGSPP